MNSTDDKDPYKLTSSYQGTTLCDIGKIPYDIVCNGFSIKKTIIEVLVKNPHILLTEKEIDNIGEEIKEAFAVKLRLKQGKE